MWPFKATNDGWQAHQQTGMHKLRPYYMGGPSTEGFAAGRIDDRWGTGADTIGGVAAYPMESYNGLEQRNRNRQAPESDMDYTPRQFRRFVGASGAQEVQIGNGLRDHIASGKIHNYAGEGYLYAVVPQMPGYRRVGQNAGGFHKRGPDPLSVFSMYQSGPGSQPANPGGPGKIAAPSYVNPMTG